VLDLDEAGDHPHNRARSTFIDVGGVKQPAPVASEPDVAALAAWGFAAVDIDALRAAGVLA
jgi:alpha-methylacyl-CoA racemase